MTDRSTVRIRLTFADEGTFHTETIELPAEQVAGYERLIDLLREEPGVTRQIYVDLKRLVSAHLVEDE